MTHCVIYLDESGDLGFNFSAPYRHGGSSRYITLGAVICPGDTKKYIKRFIVDFYSKRGISAGHELKWSDLDAAGRLDFANRAVKLSMQVRDIRYSAITVYKPNVQTHIRADPNKLYNYMVKLLLLDTMKQFDSVTFVPDARSIKVSSGNSLHDYLQTTLWMEEGVATRLVTQASDSGQCRPLHFTDYICGVFQSHHEDRANQARDKLHPVTNCKHLFF